MNGSSFTRPTQYTVYSVVNYICMWFILIFGPHITFCAWLIHHHAQERIKRHRDHSSLAKLNPLARLSLSDRQQHTREHKKVCGGALRTLFILFAIV